MSRLCTPIRRNRLVALLLVLIVLNAPLTAAAGKIPILAANAPKTAVYAGQTVEIVLSLTDLPEAVSCFDMEVQMDAGRFEFKRVKPLGTMLNSELSAHTMGDTTYLVYCDRDGGRSPVETGAFFSIVYTVKESATTGQGRFLFQCTSMGDGKARNMSLASARCTVQVTDPPSGNASLQRLTPDTGRLVPAFSPAQLSYTLEVGAEVDRMKLTLKTSHAQAVAKVNRETLNGKGRSTRLVVTVTAPDRSVKKYIITVLRRKDGKAENLEETVHTPLENPPAAPGKTGQEGTEEKAPLRTPSFPLYLAIGVLVLLIGVPLLFRWLYKMTEAKEKTPAD